MHEADGLTSNSSDPRLTGMPLTLDHRLLVLAMAARASSSHSLQYSSMVQALPKRCLGQARLWGAWPEGEGRDPRLLQGMQMTSSCARPREKGTLLRSAMAMSSQIHLPSCSPPFPLHWGQAPVKGRGSSFVGVIWRGQGNCWRLSYESSNPS